MAGIVRYLQITFTFDGPVKLDELKPAFDQALDWVRISRNVWIVRTTSTTEDWYKRLKPLLGPKDHFYIFGIDITVRNGWAPKWIWEWLDKKY